MTQHPAKIRSSKISQTYDWMLRFLYRYENVYVAKFQGDMSLDPISLTMGFKRVIMCSTPD